VSGVFSQELRNELEDISRIEHQGNQPKGRECQGMSANKLSCEHYAILSKGSGISDEVITARGYRTVTEVKELLELGFSSKQSKNVPGLLLPVCTPDGSNGLFTYRPDLPRMVELGKRQSQDNVTSQRIIKYEIPKGNNIDFCGQCVRPCVSQVKRPSR
jgi:hypothetical protein